MKGERVGSRPCRGDDVLLPTWVSDELMESECLRRKHFGRYGGALGALEVREAPAVGYRYRRYAKGRPAR